MVFETIKYQSDFDCLTHPKIKVVGWPISTNLFQKFIKKGNQRLSKNLADFLCYCVFLKK